jgi:cytoskeletal protein CcmA (bactofilin family)
MSVFNRNDKTDTTTSTNANANTNTSPTPPRASAEVLSVPPTVDPKVVHSVAQPMSATAPSSRARGVSVISKALKITGQLESTEDIQIDGEIEGDVRGVSVKVGNNAKVKGTVFGEEVELSGTVDGKIEAKKVVLTGTAHMSGDVVHQEIQIAAGAYVDGHLRPEHGKNSTTAKVVRAAE